MQSRQKTGKTRVFKGFFFFSSVPTGQFAFLNFQDLIANIYLIKSDGYLAIILSFLAILNLVFDGHYKQLINELYCSLVHVIVN